MMTTKKTPETTMRLTYDPEADALGLWLVEGAPEVRTRQLATDVYADFSEGRLVGMEVIRASKHYPRAALEHLASPVEYLTLPEAAAESQLAVGTLRNQILAGRLRATKRGRDWLIAGADLWTYLENRAPQGRPGRVSRDQQRSRRATRKVRVRPHRAPDTSGATGRG